MSLLIVVLAVAVFALTALGLWKFSQALGAQRDLDA